MVEIDKILSERSDERILSALQSISNSEFSALVERILGFLGLRTTRSRARGDFIIAECIHQPDARKYVVFFSRRDEVVAKQSVESLISYMKRIEAPNGLVISSSSIEPGAVRLAEGSSVGLADGPKLAALIRRFDIDRDVVQQADRARERSVAARPSGAAENVATKMADGAEALSSRDYLRALECIDDVILTDEGYAPAWRFKATVLEEMGYHEQALECYKHALDIDSASDETWFALANCLFSLARYEEELRCYDHCLQLNPANLKALVNKGYTLHRMGRYREALDLYDAALKRNYRLEKVHSNRGVTLHKLGRADEALEAYEHAVQLRDDYIEAWMNRAGLLQELGRDEEAFAAYTRVTEIQPEVARAWFLRGVLALKLERRSEARRALDECLRLNPDNADAQRVLEGLNQSMDEELGEAPRIVEEIFSLRTLEAPARRVKPTPGMPLETAMPPAPPPPEHEAVEETVEQLAEELYGDRAELLLLLGRYEEAHEFLSKSFRLEGENARLLNVAGNVLFMQGKQEAAIKTYEHAFASDPGYSPALHNLHTALMLSGEGELAAKVSKSLREQTTGWQAKAAAAFESFGRRDYGQALEDVEVALASENLAMLRNFKGVLQMMAGENEGAFDTLSRLTSEPFDASEAHSNLGVADLFKGDWTAAGSEFDTAISLRKENPPAWNNRGCLLYREERLREAIACFDESLVMNPSAVAMNNRGFTQLAMDELEDALRSFDQSLKILETPEAYNNKGITLRRLGRLDEALTAFRESLRMAPQFEDANANLRDAAAERSVEKMQVKRKARAPAAPPPPPPAKREDPSKKKAKLLRRESEKSIKAKKKSELEALCIALDISSRGTKRELVARLLKERKRVLR
ncbi:MAG: tetratricopeptide repeat protein [Methanobacteriota archaeon]|nr:MAG: tetratricopeptide repeat protein [Euryarchaeota archaeon]